MTEPTTDEIVPEPGSMDPDEIHARLEFTHLPDGGLGMQLNAVQAPENPAVYFACWLHENRDSLYAMAMRNLELAKSNAAANRAVIGMASRRIVSPDGSPLN